MAIRTTSRAAGRTQAVRHRVLISLLARTAVRPVATHLKAGSIILQANSSTDSSNMEAQVRNRDNMELQISTAKRHNSMEARALSQGNTDSSNLRTDNNNLNITDNMAVNTAAVQMPTANKTSTHHHQTKLQAINRTNHTDNKAVNTASSRTSTHLLRTAKLQARTTLLHPVRPPANSNTGSRTTACHRSSNSTISRRSRVTVSSRSTDSSLVKANIKRIRQILLRSRVRVRMDSNRVTGRRLRIRGGDVENLVVV